MARLGATTALLVGTLAATAAPSASVSADATGAGAPSGTHPSAEPVVVYRAPVPGTPSFAHPFRAPAQRWSAGHRGVDLWLRDGLPVLAPAAGTVTFAGTVVDRGVVSVLHADGRRSSVEPVVAAVVVGQQVGAGDVLGTLDGSGGHCAPRTCVHWGLRDGERYLDPMTMLPGGGSIVLLPVEPTG
ncbi:M23 family metallopeptidase [Cellulomonas sp. SG140]|uniref:M23 family metallopeptidase n=1 Tax=Cellulomonas sp. SG140 TaxID=2976536 RepID=UPI0021E859DC|nr:peptidoglycan DD-metalloendopeptidase family protein [Cellulomonas sp. SG140]